MLSHLNDSFWSWYERNYALNLGFALFLFTLQLMHLAWLFAEVVWAYTFGYSLIHLYEGPKLLIIAVDYTEIPALISVSLIYVNALRKRFSFKNALYLIFLNVQWLHLFWITDEFVIGVFTGRGEGTVLPLWLAWVAVSIDYLEVPVMFDTALRFVRELRRG